MLYQVWTVLRTAHLAWSSFGLFAALFGVVGWGLLYLLVFLFRGPIDRHVARRAGLHDVAKVSPSSAFWEGPLK